MFNVDGNFIIDFQMNSDTLLQETRITTQKVIPKVTHLTTTELVFGLEMCKDFFQDLTKESERLNGAVPLKGGITTYFIKKTFNGKRRLLIV